MIQLLDEVLAAVLIELMALDARLNITCIGLTRIGVFMIGHVKKACATGWRLGNFVDHVAFAAPDAEFGHIIALEFGCGGNKCGPTRKTDLAHAGRANVSEHFGSCSCVCPTTMSQPGARPNGTVMQQPLLILRSEPPLPLFCMPFPIPPFASDISLLRLSVLRILTGQKGLPAPQLLTHSEKLKQMTVQGWRLKMLELIQVQAGSQRPEDDQVFYGMPLEDNHDCSALEHGDEVVVRLRRGYSLADLQLPDLGPNHDYSVNLDDTETIYRLPESQVTRPTEPSSHSSSIQANPNGNYQAFQYPDYRNGYRVLVAKGVGNGVVSRSSGAELVAPAQSFADQNVAIDAHALAQLKGLARSNGRVGADARARLAELGYGMPEYKPKLKKRSHKSPYENLVPGSAPLRLVSGVPETKAGGDSWLPPSAQTYMPKYAAPNNGVSKATRKSYAAPTSAPAPKAIPAPMRVSDPVLPAVAPASAPIHAAPAPYPSVAPAAMTAAAPPITETMHPMPRPMLEHDRNTQTQLGPMMAPLNAKPKTKKKKKSTKSSMMSTFFATMRANDSAATSQLFVPLYSAPFLGTHAQDSLTGSKILGLIKGVGKPKNHKNADPVPIAEEDVVEATAVPSVPPSYSHARLHDHLPTVPADIAEVTDGPAVPSTDMYQAQIPPKEPPHYMWSTHASSDEYRSAPILPPAETHPPAVYEIQQPTGYATQRTAQASSVYEAQQPTGYTTQRTVQAPAVYETQQPTGNTTQRTAQAPAWYGTERPINSTTQHTSQVPTAYETQQPTGHTTQRLVPSARPVECSPLKESQVPLTPPRMNLAPPSGASVYTYGQPADIVLQRAEPQGVPIHTHHGAMDHLLHTSITGQDLHKPEEIMTPKRSSKREFLSPGTDDHDGVELPFHDSVDEQPLGAITPSVSLRRTNTVAVTPSSSARAGIEPAIPISTLAHVPPSTRQTMQPAAGTTYMSAFSHVSPRVEPAGTTRSPRFTTTSERVVPSSGVSYPMASNSRSEAQLAPPVPLNVQTSAPFVRHTTSAAPLPRWVTHTSPSPMKAQPPLAQPSLPSAPPQLHGAPVMSSVNPGEMMQPGQLYQPGPAIYVPVNASTGLSRRHTLAAVVPNSFA